MLFLEVNVRDPSEFASTLSVHWVQIEMYRVLRVDSAVSVPNAIAAALLALRDRTGRRPHIYFGWSEGSPLKQVMRYVLFGEGNTAPVTHEVPRRAEPPHASPRDPCRLIVSA